MKLSNVVKSIPAIGFDVCWYPESGIPIPVKWSQNISGLNNGLLLHKMILLPSEMGNIDIGGGQSSRNMVERYPVIVRCWLVLDY